MQVRAHNRQESQENQNEESTRIVVRQICSNLAKVLANCPGKPTSHFIPITFEFKCEMQTMHSSSLHYHEVDEIA